MPGEVLRINVALQGGGAHGAFTWGVLDRLLEDEGIEIAGISGTSAGALNGAALKAGLVSGGRRAARENLDWLWSEVAALSDPRLGQWMAALWPVEAAFPRLFEAFSPMAWFEAVTRLFSPYDYGLLYRNPLAPIVEAFRFDRVCAPRGPAFFVSATNVRTGKIRVFGDGEIGVEAILASACLPTLFQAIEIDDPATGRREAYWDGGYTGNPALFPLYDPALPRDIVIVNVNPMVRNEVPRGVQAIQGRIDEISFNSSLLSELRAIQFVRELIAAHKVSPTAMKDVLVHMIADDATMSELSAASKVVPTPGMFADLKQAGRRAGARFLKRARESLGREGTVPLTDYLS